MDAPAVRYYKFGPYLLDTAECLLLRDEKAVPLSPKTFEVLRILVQNDRRLVTKQELMTAVWPDSCVEEANLTVNISLLRKALGSDLNGQPYIETVPKRGYRFTAEVRDLAHAEAADATAGMPAAGRADGETAEGTRAERARHLVIAGAAVAGILTLSAVLWMKGRPDGVHPVRSIAVLPFKSLNATPDYEYLGLGIADALITRLGAARKVIVRPTSAVRKFGSLEQDSLACGRQLQVDAVLEGSIQTMGQRIRITVNLLRVADGAPLWSDKFEDNFTDMFAVEDSISRQLASVLALKLTESDNRNLLKLPTDNGDAYQLYLQGRYFWNRRTGDAVSKAIEYFGNAIRADPRYALAYAGLADSYLLIGSYGYSRMPPREAMPRAESAAQSALAIDDSLAEAHASLGYSRLVYDWRWDEAERELLRAIDLNPLYTTARHWYSHYLVVAGREQESLAESRRALEIDPVDVVLNEHLGWHYLMSRDYDAAIAQCRKTIDMDPGFVQAHRVLGLAYQCKGDLPGAVAELETALRLSNNDPALQGLLGRAYALSGRPADARVLIRRLEELSASRYVSPADIAAVYAGLGEKDEAFRWLETAYNERSNTLIYLNADPGWDSIRGDPRFAALLERVGLK